MSYRNTQSTNDSSNSGVSIYCSNLVWESNVPHQTTGNTVREFRVLPGTSSDDPSDEIALAIPGGALRSTVTPNYTSPFGAGGRVCTCESHTNPVIWVRALSAVFIYTLHRCVPVALDPDYFPITAFVVNLRYKLLKIPMYIPVPFTVFFGTRA
ncbi:hypothetical protein SARC_06403 [Sphaeroforma arctica JP610]|uniref:Uncharacterized protein n=1 Tax=Sphaeroforma arctica JP610 TaxID=667725 RepID=A0A0L0FWS0_9EUKA|nr:hypothetical protein SARC_06403 [Sphaeroforma arctica JP610]KNC81272.1 hypothetical protein SARC_06403 [Sphaeroforma arctica JP610]|eukprot:XP_014155174.1 hypothetical protein SARC_06403 [Sphaeroforma arctica JP610]